jgi:hypothetical protein
VLIALLRLQGLDELVLLEGMKGENPEEYWDE